MGGGALSSNVSKLGSKEVSKNLRNFSLASKKACHCEDERSEDVAIAKSLNINEITTQSTIARNDNNREGTQNSLPSLLDVEGKFARKSRKIAFTLAEVLITLGIIGVVASMTIPNVVANYKKKVVETRLLKIYSILNQAIVLSEADNGVCSTWDWGDPNNHRNSELLEAWWNKYMGNYIPNVNTIKRASIPSPTASGNGSYMVFFKDGTALQIDALPGSYASVMIFINPRFNTSGFLNSSSEHYYRKHMLPGRDYFGLFIFPYEKCVFTPGCENYSREELIKSASNPGSTGAAALKLIMDNGWKIPDDYPIKL